MTDKPGPDPTVKPVAILRMIHLAYPPALGTSDIAEEIGISQQATQRHLKRLEEDGRLETRKVGPARIWWVSDAGKKELATQSSSGK